MATIIQIKRSSGAGAPSTGTLSEAELAYSQDRSNDGANAILYIESIDNGSNPVIHKVGGKYYTDIIDAANTAVSADSLVKRYSNGSIAANVVYASELVGNITGTVTGVAESAQRLQNARTITLDGDLEGSVSFDGTQDVTIYANVTADSTVLGTDTTGDYVESITGASGNISISGGSGEGSTPVVDLTNSGVTADTYGGSTAIPVITVDEKGRIRSASNASISTDLAISGDSGTGTVSLGTQTLFFDGALPGISTSVSGNTVVITNTGVTSAAGTAGQITASGSTGAVTFSLSDSGVVAASYGGKPSGSEYRIPALAIDAKGRTTVASNVSLDFTSLATNVIPSVNGVYNLGSATNRWKTLFVSGDTIVLGNIALQDDNGLLTVSDVNESGVVTGGTFEVASNTYVNARLATKANISDLTLEVAGDSGSESVNLYSGTLDISGDGTGGISTALSGGTVTITNTGVKKVASTGHGIVASAATGNVDLTFTGVGAISSGGHGIVASGSTGNITLYNTGVGEITSTGHGIVASAGTGNISLSFTGVGAVAGTANEIEVSAATGNITIGLPSDVTIGQDLTVTRDISIGGNLYVSGTAVTVDTETFTTNDPLIHLANNNTSSDVVDIGFEGHYYDATFGARHAGLFRDASDSGKFKLFANVSVELENATTVDTSDPGYTVATLIANLEGGTVSGLASAIAVADGGTGRTSLTANAVLYGDGTSAVAFATGTSGQVLQINSDGMVAFGGLDGGTY